MELSQASSRIPLKISEVLSSFSRSMGEFAMINELVQVNIPHDHAAGRQQVCFFFPTPG